MDSGWWQVVLGVAAVLLSITGICLKYKCIKSKTQYHFRIWLSRLIDHSQTASPNVDTAHLCYPHITRLEAR